MRKLTTTGITLTLIGTLAIGAPAATATGTPVPIALPTPTGPHQTGTTLVHLRDRNRVDPLDPQGRQRELMVQLWYPTRAGADQPFAAYAQPGETDGLDHTYGTPPGVHVGTTQSRLGAPVRRGFHKVVFFHHGLCGARTDSTAVAQELASRGYIAVALGNTHESAAVEFPGGRVETTSDPAFCLAGGDPFSEANQAILNRLLAVRVADTRFVLDQLTLMNVGHNPDASGRPLPAGLALSMDTFRVGMYGHSFGGGTAAAVMHADRRFVAGINLDGFVIGPVAQAGLDKPFLVVGTSYHDLAFDPSWAAFLPNLRGWHRWFVVTTAGHYRFIDFGFNVRRWGFEERVKPNFPETWRTVFGDIDDARSQEITARLVVSFFGRFLCWQPAPLLDRPAAFYPEIEDRTAQIP